MRILALDLGSVTGYALLGEDLRRLGTWDLGQKETRETRQANLYIALKTYISYNKPTVIIYERPFARGLHATRSLWGAAGVVEALAAFYKIPVLDQVPTAIKKWATGNGKASKDDMIAAAKQRGFTLPSEHEADAALLAAYALEKMEFF